MLVDKPLRELESYCPPLTRQPDFEEFWQQTLAESDAQPLNAALQEVAYPVERVTVYRVSFDGFGQGTRIVGWYLVPKDALCRDERAKIPAIIQYHGYSGNKGTPGNYLHWALQGFCVLAVDVRGQNGDTPDNALYTNGSAVGFMTKGIDDPLTYYYRFVYMDCVRAVSFVRSRPEIGPLFLSGGSQGGGLTLAVAALAREKGIIAAMPDVPFLCHFERALEISSTGPYQELISHWALKPTQVHDHFHTLSYFDGMNLAPHIACPVLLSVALLDTTCPPSTAFAVYNHLSSEEKEMCVYPYNGHEGGSSLHEEEKYRFVRAQLASVSL